MRATSATRARSKAAATAITRVLSKETEKIRSVCVWVFVFMSPEAKVSDGKQPLLLHAVDPTPRE